MFRNTVASAFASFFLPLQTLVSEVLLKAGEVLYVPTQWFHYISNIGVNAQCNRYDVSTRCICV